MSRAISKLSLIVSTSFLLVSCGEGQLSAPQKTDDQLAVDALFGEWDKPGSPGASVAIIREGKIDYSSAYGEAQVEYGIPITPETIFHVASITKQFTAFGIALLAERGELDLDDDIRKYIPEVPDFGTTITLRQLGHHTSGLRDQWSLLGLGGWRLDDVITLPQVMKLIERQEALNFPPNSKYTYSNTGFTLMAETIARVGGKPFPIWMEENVFLPLGMDNTLIYDDHEKIVNNRAYSYRLGEDGLKKAVLSYAVAGATSLFTTADDLSIWLNNYSTMGVGGEAVNTIMKTKGILNSGEEIEYAFGVENSEYRGLNTLGHGGADAGFRSNVIYFPEHKLGVTVLSNLASFDPGGLARKIADIYLGEHMTPLEDKEAPVETVVLDAVEVSGDVLNSYTGLYGFVDYPGLTMEIILEDGALKGTDPNDMSHTFKAVAADTFTSDSTETTATFTPNDTGSFDMTLSVGQELKLNRIEQIDFSDDQLNAYVGDYYSRELETTYRVKVKDGGLIAVHSRHPDITLKALGMDLFNASAWFFGETTFERNEAGDVSVMSVSSGRVTDLKFEKIK